MAKAPGSIRVPTSGGPGGNPMIFLVLVLLVMVAALVWLYRLGDRDEERLEVRDHKLQSEIEIDSVSPPWDPRALSWGEIADDTDSGQRAIPVEPLGVAANRVARHEWKAFNLRGTKSEPDVIGFRRLDIPGFFDAPRARRGEPVEVVGTLLSLEKIDVFDRYGRMKIEGRVKAWEGLIEPRADLHGSSAPIKFTIVDEVPESKTEGGLDLGTPSLPPVGTAVKLQGVFFKLQEVTIDGPTAGVWILAKRLHRNFLFPSPSEIDLSLLEKVIDTHEGREINTPLYERPFWHLVADAWYRPDRDRGEPEDFSRQRARELYSNPEDYRGEFVELRARVLRVESLHLAAFFPGSAEGDHPFHKLWMIFLTTDGSTTLTMFSFREPQLDLSPSDEVLARGLFYRKWGFASGSSTGYSTSALLVALGDLESAEPVPDTPWIAIGFLAFALLFGILLIVVLRTDRRRSDLFRRGLTAKRQVQRGSLDLNEVARDRE